MRSWPKGFVPVALGDLSRPEAQFPDLTGPEDPAVLGPRPKVSGQVGSTDAVRVVKELFPTFVHTAEVVSVSP